MLAAPASARETSARFGWFDYEGKELGPHPGPGQYHNPILQGFYPDPSLIRVGEEYFLANSTFAYFPGIPIFRSRDLVHWTQIGNAIDRPDQFNFAGLGVSEGMFAPSISEHAGTWYIVNVCVGCGGNFVVTAKSPAGPWSSPTFIHGLDGAIDASLFFDEDGTSWIVYNGPPPGKPRYDGHRAIWLRRFDTKTGQPASEPALLINGGIRPDTDPVWIEGPHIFKRKGYYYLIAAEGGTGENHSEVVLRSTHVAGPYARGPANPILTQRDLPKGRPAAVTSAGHASFVVTPNGDWWAAFLATRPYADDFYNTGRETFLLPVSWQDDWPLVLPRGEAVPAIQQRPDLPPERQGSIPTSGSFKIIDKFTERKLPLYWMMLRTPRRRWYSMNAGMLELKARPVSLGSRGNPSFLGRRQQHADASASTMLRFCPARDGARAGLVALQNEASWYFVGLVRHGDKLSVTLDRRSATDQPLDGVTLVSVPFRARRGAPLFLKVRARGARYDFYYAYKPNDWLPLKLGEDGTLLSTKRAGGFVGAMLGLYAYQPGAKERE
ncbi:MAG TPA: glycoside hydrolase family 43 protein [Sphingomicrobium sp.]|nr:glycoside hydrolase family 43 protein [Sphingomicrobium sp.]